MSLLRHGIHRGKGRQGISGAGTFAVIEDNVEILNVAFAISAI